MTQSKKSPALWLVIATALLLPVTVSAEAVYPSKPVTLVVPSPPGGDTDILARHLAEKLTPRLGQPVIVVNRPGAANTVGTASVAIAEPDGYTLVLAPSTIAIAPWVLSSVKYSVTKDLRPIVALVRQDLVIVAQSGSGIKSLKQLGSGERVNYASPGSGSPMHVVGEMARSSGVTALSHIPYKGLAPAISDVVGGHVPLLITTISPIEQYLISGKLVALASTGAHRAPGLANVPTLAEQGIQDVTVDVWQGLLGPRALPTVNAQRLNKEVNEILTTSETVAFLKRNNMTPIGGDAAVLGGLIDTDYSRFEQVVKKLGIRAD
jgi:tripartite-type tricarboxylate transporter receptor subunit TctC